MLGIALVLPVLAAATPLPIELTNHKPFVRVTVNGSAPQWFILDTGNNGTSIVARECAERLNLDRGEDVDAQVGAGSGAAVRVSQSRQPVTLGAFGETLTVAAPTLLTLGHVGKLEGRRVDGLLGADFMMRHAVEIDYVKSTITLHDPKVWTPAKEAILVPLDLETGWPIADVTITPRGGAPIVCKTIIDTGVRGTITLFRPFADRHALREADGNLRDLVVGSGAGGITRGDVARLESLAMGGRSFAKPVAIYSRDTRGIFSLEEPDAILGGEILKQHRVTFDYANRRMVLEPYPAKAPPFEYDMSGLVLGGDGANLEKIRVVAVNPKTPAEVAGLAAGDEIVSIDGMGTPKLTLDQARTRLRVPGPKKLQVRREGRLQMMKVEARRLV